MGRLLDAAAASAPKRGGVRSSVDVWLDTLTGEDLDDALTVLRDVDRFGHAHVSNLLGEVHGVVLRPAVVRVWRQNRGLNGQAR